MHTVRYSAHSAHLDPITGSGYFVRPDPASDVVLDGKSLHDVDREYALADLERRGFVLSEDGYGLPIVDGYTKDGREVFGLYGLDPIASSPSLAEIGAAFAELGVMAGVAGPGASDHDGRRP